MSEFTFKECCGRSTSVAEAFRKELKEYFSHYASNHILGQIERSNAPMDWDVSLVRSRFMELPIKKMLKKFKVNSYSELCDKFDYDDPVWGNHTCTICGYTTNETILVYLMDDPFINENRRR